MTFFCVCKPLQKYKFYLYSTSKYILIPVQSNHPNIIQYYINISVKDKSLNPYTIYLCMYVPV